MSMKMRRSGRLFKSVPILLIGSDAEGRTFSEDTHTLIATTTATTTAVEVRRQRVRAKVNYYACVPRRSGKTW
jgi:hypothetical protein